MNYMITNSLGRSGKRPTDLDISHYPRAVRLALTFAAGIEHGTLTIAMPDGRQFDFSGSKAGPHATMRVRDLAFASRLSSGDVGIAESYLKGEWETPDLTAFLQLFCMNQDLIATMMRDRPITRFVQMIRHWLNRNTRSGSRRNIHAHYDLGNAFYAKWLDPGMTYSSGLDLARDGDLAASQQRKFAALAQSLALEPHHTILEIGCGWGGFAEYAARTYGCNVTAVTISREQHDFACKRIDEAGLSDKVTILLCDYRDIKGRYDRIVSIEMFEAVGESYWPSFFEVMRRSLTSDGAAGLQIITIREDIFPRYRSEIDFIRRYIFPGGMLPTAPILHRLGADHGLPLRSEKAFGLDYAETCQHWRDRFNTAWPIITTLGFDERFRLCWEYYLSYCEAGFRAGTIDVRQMVFGGR